MDKLIITVAPTGSVPTKEMTPHVPLTPKEIGEDALRCYNAGASIIHIHARDNGKPASGIKIFKEIIDEVKQRCPEMIIQISTGGRGRSGKKRGSALKLKPEMASLTTGSVNFSNMVYANPPELIDYLAEQMKKYSIKPECEIFDSAMISNAILLYEAGLIKAPIHFNFVMGMTGALPANERNLKFLIDSIPENSTWCVSGIGRYQLDMNRYAIYHNGHVRTGLEDNIYMEKGVLATNAGLVERIVRISKEYKRDIASPSEARKILSL